jgi:8-oxo-dGTP pyrophosphatase MutT (NUDIX family)
MPRISTMDGKRQFDCRPLAVEVFLVNANEELLLLNHPKIDGWQVVNGALEAGETALEAALRETYEEVGGDLQIRPLGTVHVSTFHYDEKVRYMLSIATLFAYEGGEIHPGDDMQGSDFKWWQLEEIVSKDVKVIIPAQGKWIFWRAIDLYWLWKGNDMSSLSGFDLSVRGKL